MTKLTPFEVLGLAHDASPTEVKARWHDIAKAQHPDHGGSPDEFMRLRVAYNEAYEAALLALCPECGGSGAVTVYGGFTHAQLPCPECDGGGRKY